MGATEIDFCGIAHVKVEVIAHQKYRSDLWGEILSEMPTSTSVSFNASKKINVKYIIIHTLKAVTMN